MPHTECINMRFSLLATALLVCGTVAASDPQEPAVEYRYGVDVSFPMHNGRVSDNFAWLPHNVDPTVPTPNRYKDMPVQPLGDRQKFYDDFIQGCRDFYADKGDRCDGFERARVEMSLRQPQSMQNYTEMGFKKIRAPEKVFSLIKKFWEKNKVDKDQEEWPAGYTYTNHWDAPSYLVRVDDSSLRGGGSSLRQEIWDAAYETIQEWTGQELIQCSMYGIRVYTEGAVLASHVDRLPLVSSAIINVDQDVEEPWPLEVIGHDGKAHNVTMEPGDMVLYESHSIVHGRPFPLKGRHYANIFIHFEPVGHSSRHDAKTESEQKDVHHEYKQAIQRRAGGHEADNEGGLPPYIIAGTPEEENWRMEHPQGFKQNHRSISSFATGSTSAHMAAQKGDLKGVESAVKAKGKHLINLEDENGWTPFHEAARGGHESIVKFLFDNGADVNKRTNSGEGGTPLYLASEFLGDDHPVTKFLESVGGEYIEPEL